MARKICAALSVHVCATSRWADANDLWLQAACAACGIEAPPRLPAPSTVRHGVADYMPSAPSRPTTHWSPRRQPTPMRLCCRRVAAVRAEHGGVDFVELSHRNMQWAPIAVRGDAGILAWRLSWVCPRCSRSLDWEEADVPAEAGLPCADCHRPRVWEFDAPTATGHLICACGRRLRPGSATTGPPVAPPLPQLVALRTPSVRREAQWPGSSLARHQVTHTQTRTSGCSCRSCMRHVVACRLRPLRHGARTCAAGPGGTTRVMRCATPRQFRSHACSRHYAALQTGAEAPFPVP